MKNQHVGYLILGITAIFLFIVISFNTALEAIVNTSCTHGDACPMHTTLKTQKAVSYSLIGLLTLVGLTTSFFLKEQHKPPKKNIDPATLDEEEKQLFSILQREQGSVYQSDLVKETKLSKVKVTRILDKLEGKGLLERKRRGMANIVLLRN